ncbi:MAG: aminotransferase class I/II-fold pyridoxal phosphate-dependent enzyme [Ilumatobacter sp.]|uniref:aminotransferase class I/II-fold pyridoxal phosphate-dependent enzyme n=1 Tax=Ilumatobacter sp. TaxID=1967498 RepID=UPI003C761E90
MASDEHGGDAGAVAAALGIERSSLVDLSMSMNPVAPDVRRLLADRLDTIADYPDATVATLAVAEAIGVDGSLILLTNGGSEAIALVASTMDAGHVVEPEFSLYARHLRALDPRAPRWRSNPSNPLGRLAEAGAAAAVWDEAFWPIATGTWTDRRLDDQHVWRLGSLTKLWACPGLRLGYVIAPDEQSADSIRRRQPRWSVSSLALAVVEPMLELTDLATWSTTIADLRRSFAEAIGAQGFSVRDTDANWILVDDEPGLRERLIRHGVLVRDCCNFGLAGVSRVAVPRADEMERVVRAFQLAGPT